MNDIDWFGWINLITKTDDAWVYLVFATVGLYSNIYWSIRKDKRGLSWGDLGQLAGQLPLVWSLAIVIDASPLASLAIGILPDRAFALVIMFSKNSNFLTNLTKLFSTDNTTDKTIVPPPPSVKPTEEKSTDNTPIGKI